MAGVLVVRRGDVVPFIPGMREEYTECDWKASNLISKDFFGIETFLMEREQAEQDPSHLQLIPYIVLVNAVTHEIFAYTRGKKGNEQRLHAKTSIGLGGHIDTEPNRHLSLQFVIAQEALRELNEEIGLDVNDEDMVAMLRTIHTSGRFLVSQATSVDGVHLGIALGFTVDPTRLGSAEHQVIENGRWVKPNQLCQEVRDNMINLETWSAMALANINQFMLD